MGKKAMYPILQINMNNIYENAKKLVDLCRQNGISVTGVIKGFNGIPEVAKEFIRADCEHIASSRIEQLLKLKKQGITKPTMLNRIPRPCELEYIAGNIDISLNSEWHTVEEIEKICRRKNVMHSVVLMLDVGDLREGFFDKNELINLAEYIEKSLRHVKFLGIGTNVGCYGSIKPSQENIGSLCTLAEDIENKIGRKLEIVSGGASTSIPLLLQGKMPTKVNNLRFGEAILINRDLPDLWNIEMKGMHQDTFILKAQVIEVKNKPSHPIGETFVDAYGNKPIYIDKGIRKRALLAVGKQDFGDHTKLIPLLEGVETVGSSSDHLIIDIEDCKKDIQVGDVLEFMMFYQAMVFLSASQYVKKVFNYQS
ncbi:MAG: alanine racemase [Bacillota bacterium]